MNFREVEEALHDLGIQVYSVNTEQSCGQIPLVKLECVYYGEGRLKRKNLEPERIIKNGPATIVTWHDGSKTIVKRAENEPDDEYAAYTAALAKKLYGSTSAVKRMIERKTVQQKPKKNKTQEKYADPFKAFSDGLKKIVNEINSKTTPESFTIHRGGDAVEKIVDICPIDKPCKPEKSTMDYELGSLNDLARKQYEEFLNNTTAKDEWICPKCGKHYQWQYNEKGRYAFCPSCQLATKTEATNKEK